MDEELMNGETQLEASEDSQRQGKEDEYSLDTRSIKSQGILVAAKEGYEKVRQGISSAATSQNLHESLFMDDAGVMVEELTVRSYNGSSLDIGTSNNRQQIYNRQNQWRSLYQVAASDSGTGNSLSDIGCRNSIQATSSAWEDVGSTSFPEMLTRKSLSDGQSNVMEHLAAAENKESAADVQGGIRTKMISKSGFAEYFIKNTLKGKGIVCKGPSSDGFGIPSRDKNQTKTGIGSDQSHMKTGVTDQNQKKTGIGTDQKQKKTVSVTQSNSNIALRYGSKTAVCPNSPATPGSAGFDRDDMTLRGWLQSGRHKASKVELLSIFRNIVNLVDESHSQGVALNNLRPSCIKMLPSNQVMLLGLPVLKQALDSVVNSEVLHFNNPSIRKRLSKKVTFPSLEMESKKQKINDSASDRNVGSQEFCNEYQEDIKFSRYNIGRISSIPHVSNASQLPWTSLCERFEDEWYTSPEGGCTTFSNIYCLGVLLFELLARFDSERAHIAAMSDLHDRILPPVLLSENPKEAGFCLWLLHPEPSKRPSTREILQSEVINGFQELNCEELSSNIEQDDAESELLLHFLFSLNEKKQKDASELVGEIKLLESDIEEVERRHNSQKSFVSSASQNGYSCPKEIKKEILSSGVLPSVSPLSNANDLRLLRNMSQLESAYFSMRSKVQPFEPDAEIHPDKDILKYRENWYVNQKGEENPERKDTLGTFFDGLCKYACYSKFEVRGLLRNPDSNNLANVICSLSFDRDEDYFASAGISKKIKVFDFNTLCDDSVDIQYPVVEMSNRSKLSCVCWNNYIKNYLASTDYDGVVKLWDASTGQEFSQFTEHQKRAWSVDFSPVCPTKLASGSDDFSVKLWSISERNSVGTIRNDANICCVQFSAHSSHLLAFGSANFSIYCYDLRNLRSPWCVLAGHRKAVSYVKFLDSETLVSASTDNTLKIWDLNKASPVAPPGSVCSLTLSGHTNEKNFVGLSVADGYIACGSETNEVYSYYRSLPMPITSHKFGSIDPISGKETDDDNGQFVSSVCWRGKSDMLIVANSSGSIKVLQMV